MPAYTTDLHEIGKILLDHYGVTEGDWEIGLQFQFDTRSIAENETDAAFPAFSIKVIAVNLVQARFPSPSTVKAGNGKLDEFAQFIEMEK